MKRMVDTSPYGPLRMLAVKKGKKTAMGRHFVRHQRPFPLFEKPTFALILTAHGCQASWLFQAFDEAG